jgi:gamma-glutamyl hercynylcysteine S-oxide hydrolase
VPLHDFLFAAPHALVEQARRPRHQASGDCNPDGWGVAWFDDTSPVPHRYRTVTPIWEDDDVTAAQLGARSGAFVAAARLASPGATVEVTGNAPFVSGDRLFSLNGYVRGYREGAATQLRAQLSPERRAGIQGTSDSEMLFALVLDALDDGAAPAEALAAVIARVEAVGGGRLNLLLADSSTVTATRWGNSLYARDSIVVSEPLDDDPGWYEIPDRSVVTMSATGTDVGSLGKVAP